ncbi:hypothetical protein GH714_021583 [Hevea brasiliensis]|uniref:Uncharacterized protein n=1 Tax=Hevea brasiliensis TaxID=3981 RepID=A0A6A6LCH9_HEVBR|nr:hypothetical protein GH714_021583 [Hevea brasiliensis]
MAIISVSGSESPESIQTPLLLGVVQGSVDYKGLPIYRSNSGGWRSASFILGMELAERLAYYGIASNLITYLTGPLGQSTATAAENVNAWTGASFLFPLIGAFVADLFSEVRIEEVVSVCIEEVPDSIWPFILSAVSSFSGLLEQTNLMKKTLGNTMPKARSSTGGSLTKPCLFQMTQRREKVCSLSEVEEAKAILGLFPYGLHACYLVLWMYSSQLYVLSKEQLWIDQLHQVSIPPASFQSIVTLSVVTFIPIYDRIIVPLARDLTREPSGITMLQRIGTGMFFSALSMAIAAIVEMKRLAVAREYGLVDKPNETLPMSIWWLVPQYITDGVAHALTAVGMQEFFYDQVPRELRSVGLSLFISAIGVGSLISSFLISIIEMVTGGKGRDSWFANNLNRAHLDYFYWLLAGLGTLQLVAYLYFAKKYVNKR